MATDVLARRLARKLHDHGIERTAEQVVRYAVEEIEMVQTRPVTANDLRMWMRVTLSQENAFQVVLTEMKLDALDDGLDEDFAGC